MNGPRHYADANELIEKAVRVPGTPAADVWLKAAELHAHLARTAVLAAQSMSAEARLSLNTEWYAALDGDSAGVR